jgi:Tfp pilus assembly protein PilN
MIRINLAPPIERSRLRSGLALPRPSFGMVVGILAVLVLGAAGGYWRYLVLEERGLAAAIETTTKEIEALKVVVGQAAKMREQLADLEARLKAIDALTVGQSRPLVLFDVFVDTVPGDVWITGMEERGMALRVVGAGFSSTAVANFMAALRASGKFKEVDIVVSRRDLDKSPHLVTFEVTCRFDT